MSEKKITVQCCVPACYNTNHMEPQILFFPFPKRREMQERWLHAIRRPELKKILPVDQPFHMFICLDHFKKSDIVNLGGRTCLKAGVIPSVFKWMEHEKKMELPAAPTGTLKSKLVKKLDKEIIMVTCGTLEAELHKEKFYCPGIHRECIKYNNQFITPKMFMIMGDKERLKDWKNAVRIHGVKIRKFIENKQLDFYRHKEFCTGRCVARLPVNLFRTKAQPPEHFINTSGDISNVRFLETDRRPEFSKPDARPYIENEIENENENENENESDESIDEKPDIDVLNELLKRPIPTTITQGSNSSFGITDNQVFWRGVVKLGLIAKCFDVIKDHINTLQTDFVLHNVRQEDAHELSCIVREMGLSNNLQHMLASCKQDMDNHYEKLDQEMEELKQKVSQYENRKRMLKLKSDEFKAILNLNTPKAATQTKMESDDSDEEVSVHFASSSPQQNSTLPSNKRLTVHSPSEVAGPSTKRLKFSTDNGSEEVLDVLVTSPANVSTIKLEKVSDTAAAAEVESKVEDDTSTLPKIVSVTSMQQEEVKSPNATNNNSDVTALEDIQNVVANGQQMAEQILQSAGDDEHGDHADDDMQAIDTNNISIINESSISSTSTIVKKDQSPPNPNVRTVLWVKSNGTSEYITFSNNSETNSSAETVTVCDQSEDSTTSPVTNQTASIPVPPAQSKDEEISAINSQSSDIADKANQSEITTENKLENVIKADGNKDSNNTEEKVDKKQSEDQSNDNIMDELERKTPQNIFPSEPVSETGPIIKVRKLSEKSLGETSEEGDSKRCVSPLFGDDLFTDIVGSRRSMRKRVAKVKDDL
ncbi:glucocorticoid modulatory element-binding protein 1 [Patella vulgata]|uniref:glucocorticoid modulatory element-binding protein 1 n=1 Tax=Patella vulgata TaxID=6465 RepID=UPI0024A819E1|nr:glucocorticoid modulatory element-binding protein 1 [Patella vulgata]XP_050389139.2 glucocorticoid modulatory element-binding protein 1 [Patella vulgata]XP_050389140.2 glucocorticoid modulatory element-binding protein 1 [Patella vulgata]XP_050389141.2 glucocorticoid modulatory element-binding protein 1 [Patella vulgata]